MLFPAGRKPLPMFLTGILIVVGAWLKRFLIVMPTLLHPFLPMSNVPDSYQHYFPTWEEWAITAGSLSGALLLVTLFARIFPIIPIEETIKERRKEELASLNQEYNELDETKQIIKPTPHQAYK
jgi:Polysulphide reductase